MKTFSIAVIPGDGIGREVTPEGIRLLDAVSEISGAYAFKYEQFPLGKRILSAKRQDDGRQGLGYPQTL